MEAMTTPVALTERETLQRYEKRGALLRGHFRLTSGLHSDIYLQSALVLQHPEAAPALRRSPPSAWRWPRSAPRPMRRSPALSARRAASPSSPAAAPDPPPMAVAPAVCGAGRRSSSGSQHAVLQQDHAEPEELRGHEHGEPALAALVELRAVLPEAADDGDQGEQRAVVGLEQAVAGGEPAGEAPQHPRRQPAGQHGEHGGRAGAGAADQPRGAQREQAAHDDHAAGEPDPASHARPRYSGRQRSSRISSCLMASAMTMPMTPSEISATIMSAAFSVPSDWMIR